MPICLICGGLSSNLINFSIRDSVSEKINIYECCSCGVQFLNPQKSQEELKDYYDGTYRKIYSDANFYNEDNISKFYKENLPEAENRVKRVEKYLKKSDEILEIGCSSGYFLTAINEKVSKSVGTEWDDKNAYFVEDKLGFSVKKNIEDFNMKFDKIFMFHVLEHINNPIEFLQKISKYLKKDGMLFIEVPNREDILLSGYKLQEFGDFYYQMAHLWYFNKNSLGIVCESAGYDFEIECLQRYDISNHLYWLKNKKPGGMKYYSQYLSDEVNNIYAKELINNNKADTLFAICRNYN